MPQTATWERWPETPLLAVPQHVKLMGVIHICAEGPCLIGIRGAQPDGRRDGRLEIVKSSEAHI